MAKTVAQAEREKNESGMAVTQDLISRPDARAYDEGVRLAESLVKEFQEKLKKAREAAKPAR